MKTVCSRVGNGSNLASGLFPESRKGVESPNLRTASFQVQLRLSFLRSKVFWHGCGCFRCHNPYPTPNLKKFRIGDDHFFSQARFGIIVKKKGVAELRYDKCCQGMFWLPDLPRLRAIEIIGWIGNRNIQNLR